MILRNDMPLISRRLPGYLCLLLLCTPNAQAWRSSLYPADWQPGFTDGAGRFLHDFSYAGYRLGEEPIPDHPPGLVYDVTQPPYGADPTGASDATTEIQQAINDAGAAGGGIVYLPAGTYNVAPQGGNDYALRIWDSGVVLRGAGPGTTIVHNTETSMRQKEVIKIRPSTGDWEDPLGGTTTLLTADLTVPTTTIPVASVSGFSTGEYVVVRTDSTTGFATDHGMSGLWDSSMDGVMFYRQITAIDAGAGTLTIDIPTRYWMKMRDNARVYKTAPPIEEAGVEDLSISMKENTTAGFGDSDYSVPGTGAYEVHNSHMVEFYHTLNCWARRVDSYRHPGNASDVHMLSMGILMQRSRGVTVEDCVMQKPLYIGGGGNGYMFRLRGNDCLVQDCKAIEGRHNYTFFSLTTSGNVVHDSIGRNPRYPSDFHGHLSMANLFDVMTMDGDCLEGVYRPAGTVVHGQTTTESVYWNTYGTAAGQSVIVESRAFGWGYVIGTRGPKNDVTLGTADGTAPEDLLEGKGLGDTLEPESLYDDQLARRLGLDSTVPHTQVVANVVQMRFGSDADVRYALEAASDLVSSNWLSTGYGVIGNGESRSVYGPDTDEAERGYRLANQVDSVSQNGSLFTETIDPAIWNEKITASSSTSGNVVVSAPTPFNDGDALRMYDLADDTKPELQGELVSALSAPFRVDFLSYDQSTNASSSAIRFRMANAGKSVTSQSRCAFSLSWQADGRFTATYSGVTDGDPNDVDTRLSDPLVGVHAITMIANGAVAGTYSYNAFGLPRTLDPLRYDLYIDGVLLNSGADPDVANGMKFHTEYSSSEYNPALGLQRFGLIGSSNAQVDPDYLFDNLLLGVGVTSQPQAVSFSEVLFGPEPGFSFASQSNIVYALQTSTNAADPSPTWISAGMEVTGDGTARLLFDPAGYATGKTYRVVETP